MSALAAPLVYQRLDCGIELGVQPIEGRPLAAIEIRAFAGSAFDAPKHLGVAHILDEVIAKGTSKRDGRGVKDAFDEIGATHGSSAGRELIGFSSICLPEYIERVIELHAEIIRTPTFPEDACEVAVELTKQELAALEDDPGELAKKFLHQQAYGDPLGRHGLGELETVGNITQDAIHTHWRKHLSNNRMMIGVSGAIDPDAIADMIEKQFAGFHGGQTPETTPPDDDGRSQFAIRFKPGQSHTQKDLEQEQIAICFPGASATDPDWHIQRVTLGVLSGGMSSRLFTEVREKQGLVYWVGAWIDQPRNGGMVHLGASSTPQNVDKTYRTLLREVDRLGEDVTEVEVKRAIVGIVARTQTRGDITRSRASRIVDDLFYWGKPIPIEERLELIQSVTADDVRRYLNDQQRDQLSVVTVGPKPLD